MHKLLFYLLTIFSICVIIVTRVHQEPNYDIGYDVTVCVENICNEHSDVYNIQELLYEEYSAEVRGGILYSISDISTDFRSSYIAIYVNDIYSPIGVLNIPTCGCKYNFKEIKL